MTNSTVFRPKQLADAFRTDQPGEIGLPAPGLTLKLIPCGESYEVRVRGPNVTPGYLNDPELTLAAFDDEGFYRVGDTVAFVDPERPYLGLRFTGRLSENFKLANGTWVVSGKLRAALLAATGGLLQDLVVAGENRNNCAVLAWLNPSLAKHYALDPASDLLWDPGIRDHLIQCLRDHNADVGSSERVAAILLLGEPPSLAAGEVTDKAYVNQRAVLARRSDQVDRLYAREPVQGVIRVE